MERMSIVEKTHVGSEFDNSLKAEGLFEDAEAVAA